MNPEIRKRLVIAGCGIFLALILVLIGIFRGEVPVVFEKASRICMECIGIG